MRYLSAGILFVFAAQAQAPVDLGQASLEQLMDLTVTSVSKRDQKLSQTAAAVFVISQEDIRRSGATNIPDLLRMAPGVDVAQIDANTWAISIRGFNARYSDKILVLIDGRSVFAPSFSGVYWDQINVPLETIDRIEVIRGPGGTVWGANAMNGVISIITKSSKATQGGVLVAEGGSQISGSLAQYGGKAGADTTYRAFGGYSNTDSAANPASNPANSRAADGWHEFHGGFRFDLEPSARDKVTIQGDLYSSAEGQTLTTVLSDHLPTVATLNDPITVASGDLEGRWSHTLQNGSDMSFNASWDRFNRLDQVIVEKANIFNIDFQHHLNVNSRNNVVWGLGFRVINDSLTAGYDTVWSPVQRTDYLYDAFVQDEIKLTASTSFTIGTKLEHNSYTGFEYEPSAQFVWAATDRQTIWLSASQAIRQPSRQDTDLQYDIAVIPLAGNNFGVLQFTNNNGIRAEQLRDYEAGYRTRINRRLSVDLATFRGYYSHLETTEPGDPYFVETPGPPHEVFPLYLGNGASGRTYGGEAFATWDVTRRWRLSPGYSLMHMSVLENPTSQSSTAEAIPGDSPKHEIQLRSTLALRNNLDWDTSLYYVGRLADADVPGYIRLDVQLRWRVLERVDISLGGQNLLKGHHEELDNAYEVDGTQLPRSVLGKITWRF